MKLSRIQTAAALLHLEDAAAMFESIGRNRQLPAFAESQGQYTAKGREIRIFLDALKSQRESWNKAAFLAVGTRVRFLYDWDILPHCLIERGETGTVVENGLPNNNPLLIKIDNENLREALKDWDGEVQLLQEDWDMPIPIESL